VGGKLTAVYFALKWCSENNVNEVSILYDYPGLKKWATGEWHTDEKGTWMYAMNVKQSSIKIRWHKLSPGKKHYWNERAREIARKGLMYC